MDERKNYLIEKFSEIGWVLTDEQAERFLWYGDYLVEKNRVMNLTAITEYQDIVVKHFIDSNMLWSAAVGIEKVAPGFMAEERSVIDIGTGAGFPGVPLKILRPEISLTLLDALKKRIGFLEEVKEYLSLEKTVCRHDRSEDAARDLRESFDLAVSRAVARLSVLAELALPFVRVGGFFVAYKSGEIEEELEEAKTAIKKLGGKTEKVLPYSLPGTDIKRSLIYIRKTSETPEQYPRKAGKIEKDPLK